MDEDRAGKNRAGEDRAGVEEPPSDSLSWRVFTEDWEPSYGSAANFEVDSSSAVELAEEGTGQVPASPLSQAMPLAFVDGRRRVELGLSLERSATGERVPGLAGAYAVGAVTIAPGAQARYAGIRIGRLAIWGAGRAGDITGRSGHRWSSDSVAASDPDQLLAHLQNRMREAEGELALDAAAAGWNIVLDGPLNRIRSPHAQVVGYVKSHQRQLLPARDHALVPRLDVGARTRVFALGSDRYSCYVRVGNPGPGGSAWSGIARLEFPTMSGLGAVVQQASRLASLLPRFAGVPHRDPRAPVNLTPVNGLERHLSRCLGPVAYATRSARDAVAAGSIQ